MPLWFPQEGEQYASLTTVFIEELDDHGNSSSSENLWELIFSAGPPLLEAGT